MEKTIVIDVDNIIDDLEKAFLDIASTALNCSGDISDKDGYVYKISMKYLTTRLNNLIKLNIINDGEAAYIYATGGDMIRKVNRYTDTL